MKILLVKALAESHPYNRFVGALEHALNTLGHEPVISDQSRHAVNGAADVNPLARELQLTRYDVLLSFSSFFGAVTLSNGTSLYDALGIRFIGWQLDHPIYTPQSLARALRNRYAVYSNPNHLRFAEALGLPGRGITLLAGGEPLATPVPDFQSREWPIFIAATFNGPPQALWEQLDDSPARRLLAGVVDRLLADREASLLDAFNDTAQALDLGARLGRDPSFDDEMIRFLREPLTYVRNLDRTRIIRALAESGLPLTICGPGWRDFIGERRNVIYLDHRVDFQDLPTLYGKSKIALNLNAGNGACERAIYAALAGAAVVSDDSQELARQFASPSEIAFFDRSKPDDVVATVGDLVESDGGEAVAQQGRQRALQSGLWLHRAERLVEFLLRA
jgi:hypothetical protein